MADILSQEEVDLLLSAVTKGEVPVEDKGYERVGQHDLIAYDFRRPERVSTEQMRGLQSLFEAFARELSIALPPFLRTVVRVDLTSIDQLTYDEFILSITRPTSLSVIDMSPLDGNAVIELSTAIVFPIVDRLLGGKGLMISEVRELTEVENRIIHRIVMIVLGSLKRSWVQLIEFDLSVKAQESDPLIVQIVAGSEMVILVAYEIHIGEIVGTMNVCIPLVVLTPVLDQITQQTRFTRRVSGDAAQRTQDLILNTVRKVRMPVDAILGHATLHLEDIARLQVGDIIQLDSRADEPIPIEVGGVARFLAKPGCHGEQSAVQVLGLLRD